MKKICSVIVSDSPINPTRQHEVVINTFGNDKDDKLNASDIRFILKQAERSLLERCVLNKKNDKNKRTG